MDDAGREQAAGIQIKVLLELQNLPLSYYDIRGVGGTDELYDAIGRRYLHMILRELQRALEAQQELREEMGSMNLDWPERPSLDNIHLYMAVNIAAELRERGAIESIEDLEGFEVVMATPGNMDAADLDDMESMYAQNYRDKPKLQEALIQIFRKANERDDGWFYLIKLKGRIVAFDRVDDEGLTGIQGRHLMHFGAMNVAPDLRGAFLGEALLDRSIGELFERGDTTLMAECDVDSPIARVYLNRRGFIARGYNPDFHGIGVLSIVADPALNALVKTRDIPTEQLLAVMESPTFDAPRIRGNRVLLAKATKPSEIPLHYLNEGFILAGIREVDGGVLGVFESRKPDSSTEPDAI